MNRTSRQRFLIAGTGAFAAFGPYGARAAEAYTLRLSGSESATSIPGTAALRLASAIHRRTNGQLTIEVYPNLQLAKQAETADALVNGIVDLAINSSAILQPLAPRVQILDAPFLFKNLASGFRVLDGPIGNDLFADAAAKGIIGLGWGTGGFRELETTSRPIVTPADMKGLRMRIQPGAIYVATFQALGSIPVTTDMSETYLALQQHTVDGMDINLDSVTTGKFYTVIKNIALSHHILSVIALMGSRRKIEALPAPLQKVLREEGKAVIPFWRSAIVKRLAEDVDILKSNGVSFTNVQFDAFRKMMDPVYAVFEARVGKELLDRITRAAASA